MFHKHHPSSVAKRVRVNEIPWSGSLRRSALEASTDSTDYRHAVPWLWQISHLENEITSFGFKRNIVSANIFLYTLWVWVAGVRKHPIKRDVFLGSCFPPNNIRVRIKHGPGVHGPLLRTGSMDTFFKKWEMNKNRNSAKIRFDKKLSTDACNCSQIFSCANTWCTLCLQMCSWKTVKLIQKLSAREEFGTSVQRLALSSNKQEFGIHCF